jgi:Dolichyl-phosphate-mannose-protein mannosyltransferase
MQAADTYPLTGINQPLQASSFISNARKIAIVIAILSLLIAIPLYFLRGIGVFDDSVYLKFGQLMHQGLLPYRDYFDNKLPGTGFVSWALAAIGNNGWFTPRLFMFTLSIACCALIYRHGRRCFNDQTSTWFATALLACSLPLTQGYSLHTENTLLLFAILGTMLLAQSSGSYYHYFFGGVCLGVATCFKQPALLLAAGAGAALLLRFRARIGEAIVPLLLIGAGFVIPLSLLLWWVISQGIFNEFRDAVTMRGLAALGQYNFSIQTFLFLCVRTPAIAISGLSLLLCAVSPSLRQRVVTSFSSLDVWLFSGLCYLIICLKVSSSNGHYALPATAAFAVVNGQILAWALSDARLQQYRMRIAAMLMTVLLGYIAAIGWGSYQMIADRALKVDLAVQSQMQQWLDQHSTATTPIHIYSRRSPPRLYLMSGRPPYTVYIYSGVENYDLNHAHDILAAILAGKPPLFALEFPREGCLEEDSIKFCSEDLAKLSQWYDWTELATEALRWDRVVIGARKTSAPNSDL